MASDGRLRRPEPVGVAVGATSGSIVGRRSRKRPLPPPAERREQPPPPGPSPRRPAPVAGRRARLDEAPKAPWSPFPLVELCILGGLVLMVVGLLGIGLGVARVVAVAAGALVFVVAFLVLRAAFRRRTGGMAFRV